MTLDAEVPPASTRRRRIVLEGAAYVTLVLMYVCDAITPADLSLEVGYEVPVALAALTSERMPIVRVALCAAIANIVGYMTDSAFAPFTDTIGFQNRVIAFASLTLVSALAIVVQSTASRNARLAEQRRASIAEAEMSREIARRGLELEKRQDMIGELVEAIAHDVRTPLAALSLTLNQALRGQYGELPESYRDVAKESRVSIGEITRLADTLLAIARFESEHAAPQISSVDVAELVKELVNEFTPLADTRDIALICDVPALARVEADGADLRRALANLIANAVRHTPPGGRVLVCASADRATDTWRLTVVDNGVGIAEARVPQLFARYTRGAGGTGLGLHIVKRIAESVGGSVLYEPVAPHGSRFSMQLPAASRAA